MYKISILAMSLILLYSCDQNRKTSPIVLTSDALENKKTERAEFSVEQWIGNNKNSAVLMDFKFLQTQLDSSISKETEFMSLDKKEIVLSVIPNIYPADQSHLFDTVFLDQKLGVVKNYKILFYLDNEQKIKNVKVHLYHIPEASELNIQKLDPYIESIFTKDSVL